MIQQEQVMLADLTRRHCGLLVQYISTTVNITGRLDRVDHRHAMDLEVDMRDALDGRGWTTARPLRQYLGTTLVISGWESPELDPRLQLLVETELPELEQPPAMPALEIIQGQIVEEQDSEQRQ